MRMGYRLGAAFAAAVWAALAPAAVAQDTSFSYQGRLDGAGGPAGGLHDFRFKLFNAAAAGTQVGEAVCADDVAVTDGYFTVQIDFGQQFATTAPRFLEIEVRADTGLSCASAGGFALLAPRQQITAAPMSTHARSAFALDASDGSPANAVFVDGTGNVGIGSTSPLAPLHIAFPAPLLILQDTDNPGAGQVGLLSFRNSTGVETGWLGFGPPGNANATFMNNRVGGHTAIGAGTLERLIVTPAGSVGVGTATPLSTLDVRGDVRFGSAGQFIAPAAEESLRIVRGTVHVTTAGISVVAGSGFTPGIISVGRFQVNFTTPFTGVPTVTASAGGPGACADVVAIASVSAESAVIWVTPDPCSEGDWRGFHFIAVGPR